VTSGNVAWLYRYGGVLVVCKIAAGYSDGTSEYEE